MDINKQFTEEQLIDKHVKTFQSRSREGNADSSAADPGLHPQALTLQMSPAGLACGHEGRGTFVRWWQKGESSHHLGKQSENCRYDEKDTWMSIPWGIIFAIKIKPSLQGIHVHSSCAVFFVVAQEKSYGKWSECYSRWMVLSSLCSQESCTELHAWHG